MINPTQSPHLDGSEGESFETFLRTEISSAAEKIHGLHLLEQEYSPETNLLISRILEQHRTYVCDMSRKAVVVELRALATVHPDGRWKVIDNRIAKLTAREEHDPVPPDGCNCASFWTIRGTHKKDCPLAREETDE